MRIAVQFIESSNQKLNKIANKHGDLDIYINATFQYDTNGFQTSNIEKIETQDGVLIVSTKNSTYKFKPLDTDIQDNLELNYLKSNNLEQDLEDFFDIADKTIIGF